MKQILIIGPISHPGIGKTYGGTTVLMQDFYDYLKANNIEFRFIQSNKFVFKGAFTINFVYVIIKCFIFIPFSKKVMVNASSNGTFYLAPFIFIMSAVFNSKFVFRKFGGGFDELYTEANSGLKYLIRKTILKADLIFVETQHLVNYFSEYSQYIHWFPNVRQKPNFQYSNTRKFKKRFVFISHVKRGKGIFEILECSNFLPDDYNIDIYGPIVDDEIDLELFKKFKVNYKGSLPPKEVLTTLNQYDVLLLPTFHPTEGYPGILIEAYSLGIPVITTNWKAIPEIVEDGLTGFLIKPQSSKALQEAIMQFNVKNYLSFSKAARAKFSDFDRDIVNKRVLDEIIKL